jgi:hypothetical protein
MVFPCSQISFGTSFRFGHCVQPWTAAPQACIPRLKEVV